MKNPLVYFSVSNPLVFNQIPDLTGKRIGVLRGWSHGGAFDQTPRQGLSQNPTFLVFPKSAHRTDLLQRFDQAIRELRRNGTCKSIVTAELANSP